MANEKRLIDANALIKEIDGIYRRHYANSNYQFIHDFFLAMFRRIKKAPTIDTVWLNKTVDAVPVVRCKECESWIYIGDGMGDCTNGRFHLDGCPDPTMMAEEFCCLGKRRDNG